MERFKLCYRMADDRLIIPARLPEENQAALNFDKTQAIAYELEFKGFLPRHIMPGLIVSRHQEIVEELMWQNGVQLCSPDLKAHALVTANYHLRCLSLWIHGDDAVRYFERLLDTVQDLQKHMTHMQMTQSIVLNKRNCRDYPNVYGAGDTSKVPLELIWDYQQANYECFPDGQRNWYNLQEVLRKVPKDTKPSGNYFHIEGDVNAPIGVANHHGTVHINSHNTELQQLTTVYNRLGELEDQLAIEANLTDNDPALRELKHIRNALKILQQPPTEPEAHNNAYEKLSRFGDRLKQGSSQLVNALETLQKGGEAIAWLKTAIPPLTISIAKILGIGN